MRMGFCFAISSVILNLRIKHLTFFFQLGNVSGESWNIHLTMISMFQDFFGSQACPTIVRYNNFSDFIDYFVQKVSDLLILL